MQLLEFIGRQVVNLMGNVDIELIKVTPDEIILSNPIPGLPYKIANIAIGDITIHLKKE
jgi:predicted RNA-binding protein with PUA domain